MRDFAALARRVAQERGAQRERLRPLVSESRQAAKALRAGALTASEALTLLRAQARLIRRVAGYFPTPPALARRMVAAADLREGLIIVEPSAGDGAVAREIRRAGFHPLVLEINPDLRELLTRRGFEIVGHDFTEYQAQADRFLMNPPFENLQDVDHVRHAVDLLSPDGCAVSIMSQSAFFQSRAKAQDFRRWFANHGEVIEELPRGTFSLSGTQVSAKLVKLAA